MKRRNSNGVASSGLSGSSLLKSFYDVPYPDSPRAPWYSRLLASPRLLRRLLWLLTTILAAVALFVAAFTTDNAPTTWLCHKFDALTGGAPLRMPTNRPPKVPLAAPIPCLTPRGHLLGNSPDDDLHPVSLDMPYPLPFTGSHDVLGLEKTWMTPEDRYGPYGFGEDAKTYNRTRVNWNEIDWGFFQNECLRVNQERFPAAAEPFRNDPPRFALKQERNVPAKRRWEEVPDTRRTAIIIRAYDGYDWTAQDMHHIRSLIVEASLKTGGEFSVILLVHIRNLRYNIWKSREEYHKALRAAQIPYEFHSITVLWNNPLLESWYPGTLEHDTFYQVFQPVQLVAHHYPEFDHYWQFEMDMRFTGDAGEFLKALDDFSRREPRKQSHERSTFLYDPTDFSDYDDFQAAVDIANNGNSHYWGPAKIREVSPLGPKPPTSALKDTFRWGVGEDADAVVTSLCGDARKSKSWIFSGWVYGFRGGSEGPPRFFCPPAIQRASRHLLLSIHDLQIRGLRIASEATLPSFALWLGLKISYPPLPTYLDAKPTKQDHDGWFLGGPEASTDGWGKSDPQWGAHSIKGEPRMASTFWWSAGWSGNSPKRTFLAWLYNDDSESLPEPLARKDGHVYMPNMMMHPVKNN